ncbi:hypothetical protein TFLX_06119 [Thermoflexales bacterium]|nr:hypothetical protein TFLX_06119 [Thermoflexales bacterium]
MSPELGRQAFRLAIFIIMLSGTMLLCQPAGSAGQVLSVASLVVGLIFAGIVAFLARRANR